MTQRPWPCQICGVRPRAHGNTRDCYDCMPGGPFIPPPCRRCGSNHDYYASGLCRRCHLGAPQRVDSCRDCYAWGATRTYRWLCRSCVTWRRDHPLGTCRTCGRTVAVNATLGVCRLCRVQARMVRIGKKKLDVVTANRHGAQLFFADMFKARTNTRRPPPAAPAAPAWPPGRPVSHRQLVLFDLPRDLSGGRGVVGPPRDVTLAAALDAVTVQHASVHGWTPGCTTKTRAGIRLLLGMQDTPGAPIHRSETEVLAQVYITIRPVLEILQATGMLEDDRIPAVRTWFDQRIAALPEQIAAELTVWFDIMFEGSRSVPRRRPRSITTIKLYTTSLLPVLHRWADAGHHSLREITRDDILAALPATGRTRSDTGRALRSLFSLLKARRLVFANPAAGIRTWAPAGGPPMPTDLTELRAALDSPNLARALIAALVAYHALTPTELRALQLSDIHDRHLDVHGRTDRTIVMAEAVLRRLANYLDHRTQRWPTSPNPHLFIHFRTAPHTEPVGRRWIWLTLDLPGNTRLIRQDRILHEAIASGGDTRRLCDLFGLSIQAASRYTNAIREPDLEPR